MRLDMRLLLFSLKAVYRCIALLACREAQVSA